MNRKKKKNKFITTIDIASTTFIFEITSYVKLNRKSRNNYTLKMKHSLLHLKHLCTALLNIDINKEYHINVIFQEMGYLIVENSSGEKEYWPKVGEYLNPDVILLTKDYLKDIKHFESTFFHEMIHYIFYPLFDKNGVIFNLVEGTAHYFENLYYPKNDFLSALTLVDILFKLEIICGYYSTKMLIFNHIAETRSIFNNILNDKTSLSKLEALLLSMVDDEISIAICENILSRFLDNHTTQSDISRKNSIIWLFDFLVTDMSNHYDSGYLFLFISDEMDSPFLCKVGSDTIRACKAEKTFIIKDNLSISSLKNFPGGFISKDMFKQVSEYYGYFRFKQSLTTELSHNDFMKI